METAALWFISLTALGYSLLGLYLHGRSSSAEPVAPPAEE